MPRGLGALYGSVRRLPTVEEVAALAPEAEVTRREGSSDAAWTRLEVRWPEGAALLSRLGRDDAGRDAQVQAALGFVLGVSGGRVGPAAQPLLPRLANAWHVVGVALTVPDEAVAPPPPLVARVDALLRGLAGRLNAVCFRDGRLLDDRLRVLLGPEGERDEDAALAHLPAAVARRGRSEERLAASGVPVNPDLPPLPSEEEVAPRPPADVARRAQALWAVAARARGLARDEAVELLQQRGLWDAASAAEQAFLLDEEPTPVERGHFARRVEAARTLLWALGRVVELGAPTALADLEVVTRAFRSVPLDDFLGQATLRPLEELLDAACLAFRTHWAVLDAHLRGQPIPADLDPPAVQERQLALFWTIRWMDQDWDTLAAPPGTR